MRPHPRRARTDPSNPRAWGTDDRSGFVGNQQDLHWQFEWSGTRLVNKRILVFADQLDEPQRQLGTILLPPDPMPILNARPEQYAIDEEPVSVRYTIDRRVRVVYGRGSAWVLERIVSVKGNITFPTVIDPNPTRLPGENLLRLHGGILELYLRNSTNPLLLAH